MPDLFLFLLYHKWWQFYEKWYILQMNGWNFDL